MSDDLTENSRKLTADELGSLAQSKLIEALTESKQRYDRLLNNSPGLFAYRHDTAGFFEYFSPGLVNVLGYTNEEFLHYEDYLTDDPVNRDVVTHTKKSIQGIKQDPYLVSVYHKNGEIRYLQVHESPVMAANGRVIAVEGFAQDVTDLKKMEEALNKAQKIEALGTLVGGIAHNFNNILAGIVGRLYLAEKRALPPESQNDLKKIQLLTERATALVRKLMTFVRADIQERIDLPLVPLIKEAVNNACLESMDDVTLISQFTDEQLVICGSAIDLRQAVINLIHNARDAVLGRLEKNITCTLKSQFHADCPNVQNCNVRGEKVAVFTISDTGHGIEAENISRIFTPFFTTRDVGDGTGLGLSVAIGTIESHGGSIQIDSTVGEGATVTVCLPLIDEEPGSCEKPVLDSAVCCDVNETILLMDDEEMLLELFSAVLSDMGYDVITAENGMVGLELFRQNTDVISLVISDVMMPKLNGPEAVEKMRKSKPSLPVILISGYDLTHSDLNQVDSQLTSVLMKPIAIDKLKHHVKMLLSMR